MSGLCDVCGSQLGEFTCSLCGRHVCKNCFRDGKCTYCIESLCELCGKMLADRFCNYCGLLVCEDCSVKKGEETVCKRCLEEGSHASDPHRVR
ncbi:MAG: hypothetical protein ACTSWP_00190 [Candidatus Freyarchaeota archaeon]|nr:hypothetical protein [Candidatus Freyrarchaeum guaymaensis]